MRSLHARLAYARGISERRSVSKIYPISMPHSGKMSSGRENELVPWHRGSSPGAISPSTRWGGPPQQPSHRSGSPYPHRTAGCFHDRRATGKTIVTPTASDGKSRRSAGVLPQTRRFLQAAVHGLDGLCLCRRTEYIKKIGLKPAWKRS